MFDSIRRLIGASPTASEPSTQDAFKQLNSVAPLKPLNADAKKSEHQHSSFVCREAVLDRKERIAGYKFAMGRDLQARMLASSPLIRRVYDDTMLRNLVPLGVSSLLGERFAFIRLSLASLKNPLLEKLAGSHTVIMITTGALSEFNAEEVHANLEQLKTLDLQHGWTINRPSPELAEFLPNADFIEIEASKMDGLLIKKLAQELRLVNGKVQLIASELQTLDDFNICYQCHFNYFMGPFVSSRENWHPAKSEINRIKVFEALNMIRTGAEFDAIAECMRNDPILTFKLLRYINSPGMGLLQKVNDIQQALIILGRERFYRWLSLLLFDFNKPGFQEHIFKEQALTRARFMEMLAGKGSLPSSADQLFMTGLFSLMDVLTEMSIEDVLKQVALPEVVSFALKGIDGPMLQALQLSIAAESVDENQMAIHSELCGLDSALVANTMIQAMIWAEEITSIDN